MEIKLTKTQKEIIDKAHSFREELNRLYRQNEDKLEAVISVIASSNGVEELEEKIIKYENGIIIIEDKEEIGNNENN